MSNNHLSGSRSYGEQGSTSNFKMFSYRVTSGMNGPLLRYNSLHVEVAFNICVLVIIKVSGQDAFNGLVRSFFKITFLYRNVSLLVSNPSKHEFSFSYRKPGAMVTNVLEMKEVSN